MAIWNNTYEEDAGLEKVVRLCLALSQFLFPGTYIRHLFWRQGNAVQDLTTEVYVLLKTSFPLAVLLFQWEDMLWPFALMIWMMLETVLYIPTMIFASDALPSPRSYRRTKLLIFINYLEVVFAFGVIHFRGQYFNQPFLHWSDALYTSFVVTSTIGFGDFFPVSGYGKLIICFQSLFYLSYIALFISFFTSGPSGGGYFGGLARKGGSGKEG
ncbi:MAG: potassium channel family protein [Flavobacteriales bacterium]